jgi:hypothetical protein
MRATVSVIALAAVELLAAAPAAAADDSAFVSQSVPTSMVVGSRVPVSMTFRNTGSSTWPVPGGAYVLSSSNAANAANWEVSMIPLPAPVPVGATVTFTFHVKAPDAPGTYNFQWQLEDGTTFFGAASPNVPIKVVPPSAISTKSP